MRPSSSTVALERAVGRRREGRKRDQDRLHPLGRDHGDHAGGRSPQAASGSRRSCWRSSAIGITVGRLRRSRADREGRRCRSGACALAPTAPSAHRSVRLGRGIVRAMPVSAADDSAIVGTAAMIWVGGGIILHGLEVYGPPAIGHVVTVRCRSRGPRIPAACRNPRMGGRGSHIRRDWPLGRRRIDSGRRICLRADMEIAEALSAPPSEYVRSVKGRLFCRHCAPLRLASGPLRKAGIINLRIAGPSVSMPAAYLGTIEHGARGS